MKIGNNSLINNIELKGKKNQHISICRKSEYFFRMNIKNDSKINLLNKLETIQKIHKDEIEGNVSDPTRGTKECMGSVCAGVKT